MQWLRGSGGGARGSAATGVGPTGGFGRVGSVGSASHPVLKYKGAWQCLVGRASFGQARASAPPPAFPHLRAKGRLSLLLPTRPPGAEVRNKAQRSSSGCGWALVQMAVGPMHASKTCNAKRSRTRWRSRRAPPPLSPLSQFHKGLPLCSGKWGSGTLHKISAAAGPSSDGGLWPCGLFWVRQSHPADLNNKKDGHRQ